jgi:DNA-binding NarL/FixJ family response regulator
MALELITQPMREARTFVELAGALCGSLRRVLDVEVVVDLFTCAGAPVVAADEVSLDDMPGEHRISYLRTGYRQDPVRQAMVASERSAGTDAIGFDRYLALARTLGYRGAPVHAEYLPLVGDQGLVGALRTARPEPFTVGLRRDLETLSRRVSARLALLGITAVEELPELRPLTTRQLEVAMLAARFHTNREIASTLAISANSVKKHLKEAYDRLAVDNRRDLNSLLARTQPVGEAPLGVSRQRSLVVVRVDPSAPPPRFGPTAPRLVAAYRG